MNLAQSYVDEPIDINRDLLRERILVTKIGVKYFIRCKDPFGHWSIHVEKGRLPDGLRGTYTAYDYAKQDLMTYLNQTVLKDKKTITSEVELTELE